MLEGMFHQQKYETQLLNNLSIESVFFDSNKNFAGILFYDTQALDYKTFGTHKIDQKFTEFFSD